MSIILEMFDYEDISQLVSWIPDKELMFQWAGSAYTFELLGEQLENDIREMSVRNPTSLMFSAKMPEYNKTVGHVQLLAIDRVNMSARIGRLLVGEKENRNKGIGLSIIKSILDIAFNKLNLHRVELRVFDYNTSAIACYKKAGFMVEGSFRECRNLNGKYWSLLNMSILEDEYRSLK